MQTLREFYYVLNARLYLIAILSVILTYIFTRLNIVAELPTSLIGIAVVFPLVFSINAAFSRRDKALEFYGSINACLKTIYFHFKFSGTEETSSDLLKHIRAILSTIKEDLTDPNPDNKMKKEIYDIFSKISHQIHSNDDIKNIRDRSTDLRIAMIAYESLSSISDYRTPRGLKAFSKVFLNIFPILFAPYFAYLNVDITYLGYFIAITYSTVLLMLSNILDNIENPFDKEGLDDIDLDNDNRFLVD